MTLVEVVVAIFVMTFVVLMYAAMLPMAAKTAKMNGNASQALSLCQHKVDQMRAVGYGRLNYTELKAAGIVDASPTASPYSFTGVDQLSSFFTGSTGTITITDYDTTTKRVVVQIAWQGTGAKQTQGNYMLTALIAVQ